MGNRMLQLLDGSQPDVLPAAPLYLGLYLEDFIRNYYAEQYTLLAQPSGSHKVSHAEDTELRAHAFYQAYGVFKSPPDWMSVYPGASYAWAKRMQIVLRDGEPYYHELDTGVQMPMRATPLQMGDQRLNPNPKYEADIWDASQDIRNVHDIEALIPLQTPDEILASGAFELPRRVVFDYGGRRFLHTILDTPYSDSYDLLGFQGLMLIQNQRPHILHALLERKLAQSKALIDAWAGVGLHGVFVEEVFSGADMISPENFDRFVLKYNRPYFAYMRSQGLRPIYYLCGDAIPRINQISQLDIVAVAVEESKKNFELRIEDVVAGVDGRKIVFGNIDAVQYGLHAGMDAMTAEVRRQAAAGRLARGFVVSTGSPFPLDTNPRLVDTLVETAHQIPASAEIGKPVK
jgi:hypothetical protein